jgi:hypothetical protein
VKQRKSEEIGVKQRNRPFIAWENRPPSGIPALKVGNKTLASWNDAQQEWAVDPNMLRLVDLHKLLSCAKIRIRKALPDLLLMLSRRQK